MMVTMNVKGKIASLLETLPEPKLITVLDFVQFLAQRESSEVWLQAQCASAAYQDWLSSENDVYDEVFAKLS